MLLPVLLARLPRRQKPPQELERNWLGQAGASAARSVGSFVAAQFEAVRTSRGRRCRSIAGPVGGSAAANLSGMRENVAGQLPVPVNLTLMPRTRNPNQLAFEKEQMKPLLVSHCATAQSRTLPRLTRILTPWLIWFGPETAIGPSAIGRRVVDTLTRLRHSQKKNKRGLQASRKFTRGFVSVDISQPVTMRQESALTTH